MNNKQIVILDYGLGNVKSMKNALEQFNCKAKLSNDYEEILESSGLIIPGVGAFAAGMERLQSYNLISAISDFSLTDKPIMGICLGMQMLFTESEEFGYTKGLDLIKGKVKCMIPKIKEESKLPHISWNNLSEPSEKKWNGTLLNGIKPSSEFYFVHTYAAEPDEKSEILSLTNYSGQSFCSSVKKKNIYGFQFRPEKSSLDGLQLIQNFVDLCILDT